MEELLQLASHMAELLHSAHHHIKAAKDSIFCSTYIKLAESEVEQAKIIIDFMHEYAGFIGKEKPEAIDDYDTLVEFYEAYYDEHKNKTQEMIRKL